MKKIVLALAVLLVLSACDDPNTAKRALEGQGYTDINLTGYSWFSCGQGDSFSTGFVATSLAGNRVEGVVCSGWFKGSTIRTF